MAFFCQRFARIPCRSLLPRALTPSPKRRCPAAQVVVMSSAKQQLVQSLLRDRDRALGLDGGFGAGTGAPGSGADEGALSDVVDELSAMGFSPQHVQLAYERTSVRAAGGGAGGGAGGVSVESLLDWLLINLPAEQLPGQFTKGEGVGRESYPLALRGGYGP